MNRESIHPIANRFRNIQPGCVVIVRANAKIRLIGKTEQFSMVPAQPMISDGRIALGRFTFIHLDQILHRWTSILLGQLNGAVHQYHVGMNGYHVDFNGRVER
jgi:hypothetical protein